MRTALLAFFILFSIPAFMQESNPHQAMGQLIMREWLMFLPEETFNTNGPGPTLTPEVVHKNHVCTATLRHDNRWTEDKRDSAVQSVLCFDTAGRLAEVRLPYEIWKYQYDSSFAHYPSLISIYHISISGFAGLGETREVTYDVYGNPVRYVFRDFEGPPLNGNGANIYVTTFTYRETTQYEYVEIIQDGVPGYVYRYEPDSSRIDIMNEKAYLNKGFSLFGSYREINYNEERCVGDFSMERGIDTMYRRTRFYCADEGESPFAVYYKRDAQGKLVQVSENITCWSYTYHTNGLPDRSVWGEFREPEWPEQNMYFEYTYYK